MSSAVSVNVQKANTILYRAIDTGSNVSAVDGPVVVRRDTVAPVTTATTSPAQAGSNGWSAGPPTVSLSATDAISGLAKTEYSLDGGEWTTYTDPFAISSYGDHSQSGGSVRGRRRIGKPTRPLSYNSPVSNDAVTIAFKQAIGATDGLGTGSYTTLGCRPRHRESR